MDLFLQLDSIKVYHQWVSFKFCSNILYEIIICDFC
uniref:Uncharacterized protein n=1 Tax=Populus trichocarpa TaxID=3694 RepID=A0A3N7FNE8_POPTR